MPFIDSKVTVSLSAEQKDELKIQLGRAISLLGKPESFLMIGFEENYDLYMGGTKMDIGAYVAVSMFGNSSSASYENMTVEISRIFEEVLNIPPKNIYITYSPIEHWGWNGHNL